MKRQYILTFLILCWLPFLAFGQETADSTQTSSGLKKLFNWVMDEFVRYDLSDVDTNYVGAPKRHWTFMVDTYQAGLDIKINTPNIQASQLMSQSLGGIIPEGFELGKLRADTHSGLNSQLGFYLSYDNIGLGYTWDVANGMNFDFSVGYDMGSFGWEGRLHRTKNMTGTLRLDGRQALEERFAQYVTTLDDASRAVVLPQLKEAQAMLDDIGEIRKGDMDVTSYLLNAWYVFSPRRYCHSAAFWPDLIQKRSAGSWMLNATGLYSKVKAKKNSLVTLMQGLDQFSTTEIALGGGYAYNYVAPGSRLLIHGSLMPMVAYAFKGSLKPSKEDVSSEMQEYMKQASDKYLDGKHNISATGLARASIVYNASDRFVLGSDAILNIFTIGRKPNYNVVVDDWVVHAYIGVRF